MNNKVSIKIALSIVYKRLLKYLFIEEVIISAEITIHFYDIIKR